MDEKQFKDLKQFISGAIFQSEERLRAEMVTKDEFDGHINGLHREVNSLHQEVKTLHQRMDKFDGRLDSLGQEVKTLHQDMKEGFLSVGDAIDTLSDHIDERFAKQEARLDDHETRITSLEQAA